MNLTRNNYQRNSSWNAPYTFSGKEKDAETGYGYFGARYYDSGLSIWLSVDPMSDKYPSMSPYNYCANNPVILVDPDGREIDDTDGGDDPMGKSNGTSANSSTNKTLPNSALTSAYLTMQNSKATNSNSSSNNNSKDNKTPIISTTTSETKVRTIGDDPCSRLSTYNTKTYGNAGTINFDQNVTTTDGTVGIPTMELQVQYPNSNVGVNTSYTNAGATTGPININVGFDISTGEVSLSMGYTQGFETNGFIYAVKPTGTATLLMMFVPAVIPFAAPATTVPVTAPVVVRPGLIWAY